MSKELSVFICSNCFFFLQSSVKKPTWSWSPGAPDQGRADSIRMLLNRSSKSQRMDLVVRETGTPYAITSLYGIPFNRGNTGLSIPNNLSKLATEHDLSCHDNLSRAQLGNQRRRRCREAEQIQIADSLSKKSELDILYWKKKLRPDNLDLLFWGSGAINQGDTGLTKVIEFQEHCSN